MMLGPYPNFFARTNLIPDVNRRRGILSHTHGRQRRPNTSVDLRFHFSLDPRRKRRRLKQTRARLGLDIFYNHVFRCSLCLFVASL
jgi:hypothetical protein